MTRKWFQIHLSTALVLMVVAGTLLGLNLLTTTSFEEIRYRSVNGPGIETLTWHSRGFPFVYSRVSPQVSPDELRLINSPPPGLLYYMRKSAYTWIALNAASGLVLLPVIALLLERRIRRRETHKL
jgi:hypothetical protein